MPLNDIQKRQLIINQGLSPSQWQVSDDESQLIPIQQSDLEQPTIGPKTLTPKLPPTVPQQQPQYSPDSPLTTFGKSAVSEIPSALGGLGGIAAMEALPISHVAPPWSELIAGGLGAFGGSKLVGGLQKMIEPESWQQNVEASQQQNPKSAVAGNMAAMMAGGFNPSPMNVVKAGGTALKLPAALIGGAPASSVATANELRNLVNVASGAGMGAGMGVVDAATQGKMPSMQDLLLNAGAGAVFNKPNAIGRGVLGIPANESTMLDPYARLQQENVMQQVPYQAPTTPQMGDVTPPITPYTVKPDNTTTPLQDSLVPPSTGKSAADSAAIMKQRLDDHDAQIAQLNKIRDEQLNALQQQMEQYKVEQKQQQLEEAQRRMQELKVQLDWKSAEAEKERTTRAAAYEQARADALKENQFGENKPLNPNAVKISANQNLLKSDVNRPESFDRNRYQPESELPDGDREEYNRYQQQMKQLIQQGKAGSPEFMNLWQLAENVKNRNKGYVPGTEPPKNQPASEPSDLVKQLRGYKPTKQWFQILNDWINQVKGVKAGAGSPVDSEGKPVAGQYNPADRSISIGDKAAADTQPHELFHAFVDALRNSDRPYDQRLVEQYDKIVSDSPEYQSWKQEMDSKGHTSTPEEYQATQAGYEFIKRHLNLSGEKPIQTWWKDFNSYIKTRFGKHSTVEDFQRLLNYRMSFENRKLGSYFGKDSGRGVSGVVNQPDSELNKQPGEGKRPAYPFTMNDLEKGKQFDEGMGSNARRFAAAKHGLYDYTVPDEIGAYLNPKRNQPESQLPPTHEHVKSIIQDGVMGTDDASLDEPDLKKMTEALKRNVDWSSMPGVNEYLKSARFDHLDPDSWKTLEDMYNRYINSPKSMAGIDKALKAEPEKPEDLQSQLDEVQGESQTAGRAPNRDLPVQATEATKSAEDEARLRAQPVASEKKPALKAEIASKIPAAQENNATWSPEHMEAWRRQTKLERETPVTGENAQTRADIIREQYKKHQDEGIQSLKNNDISAASFHAARMKKLQMDHDFIVEKHNLDPESKIVRGYDRDGKQIKYQPDSELPHMGPSISELMYRKINSEFDKTQEAKNLHGLKEHIRNIYFNGEEPFSWAKEDLLEGGVPLNKINDYRKIYDSADKVRTALIEKYRPKYHRAENAAIDAPIQPNVFKASEMEKLDRMFNEDRRIEQMGGLPRSGHITEDFIDDFFNSTRNKKNQPYSQLPGIRPELELIKQLGPEGEKFGKAIEGYYPQKDQIYGKGMYPILQASKGLNQRDFLKVENIMKQENRDKVDYSHLLNNRQKGLYDAIRQSLVDKQNDQIAANQPVTDYSSGTATKRLPKVDPFYFPNRIDPNVIDTLMDPRQRTQAAVLKKDFLDYQIAQGVSPKVAAEKLKSIVTAYDKSDPNMTKFNANREAQGVGLPDSWMRKGRILQDMSAYYNRVSSDRAFHDNIEKNPDVAKSLGIEKDPWGNPISSTAEDISGAEHVRDLMNRLHGEGFDVGERKTKGFNRVATSLMLGPLTNIHIMGSSIANAIQYASPSQAVGGVVHAITHLTDGIQAALQNGYLRKNLSGARDMIDGQNTFLEKLSATSNTLSKIGGRDAVNTLTKGYLQSFGEYLLKQKLVEANAGNKQAQRLMENADPNYSVGKTYSKDELSKVASNFASIIHGAHDTRTLPSWMLKDTAIQPFFSLASWNVAQTNAWMRHVWSPAAKDGNFAPLIMSTLGATVGGYIIKEAREKLADKKSPIPSLSEIVNSSRGIEGNIPNVAYNLMAMSSYVGYAGVISVLGKAVEDMAHKNIPQGAAFPLDELISNPLHRANQFATAMMNDSNFDFVNAGTRFVTDLVKENVQLGRLATAWAANSQQIPGFDSEHYLKELNRKNTDLRRFEMVEGMPYEAQSVATGNPYMDMQMKQFKRTGDIGEAVHSLPSLISHAFSEYNESGGNIAVLKKEIQKIKENSYDTMPDPEKAPQSFIKYMGLLSRTQGPEVASERFMDWMMKRNVNKVKSSMVPSL